MFCSVSQVERTVSALKGEDIVGKICLLREEGASEGDIPGTVSIPTTSVRSTDAVRKIAANATSEYTLIYLKYTALSFGQYSLERMLLIADDTGATMVYADHFNEADGKRTEAPVIDYQVGALRDDFDFGSVLIYRTSALKEAVAGMDEDYKAAGQYDLRLRASRIGAIEHISEYLYYDVETDTRKSGEKLFDYVDPRNRASQIEMEKAIELIVDNVVEVDKPQEEAAEEE